MKRTLLTAALLATGLGFGTTATAQELTCDDLVWSPGILADNPNIGNACLDVVEKKGVMAAKFTARIVRQSVNSTIVQWQQPDGTWSATQRRWPAEDAYAEIEDQQVRIQDLADRQVLNVYLPEGGHWTRPVVEEPVAMAAPPEPEPVAEPEPEPAPVALPATATQLPGFALLGGLMLLLGGAVGFLRSRL